MKEWKLFKDGLPKEKTHILIKKEWSEEVLGDFEDTEPYEYVDYLTGIVEDEVLRAGDRNGGFSNSVHDKTIQNEYYWRYIE